jgi:hypothetical protein
MAADVFSAPGQAILLLLLLLLALGTGMQQYSRPHPTVAILSWPQGAGCSG